MKEHKVRQELFHRLNPEFVDDLNKIEIEISEDIVGTAVKYLTQRDVGWYYPGKSYAVAVLYAKWISEEFGGEFLEHLDDPGLLYFNDPYFVPYGEDPETYDKIIAHMPEDPSSGMIPEMRSYFEKEFMLCD